MDIQPYRILVTGSRHWPQEHAAFVHGQIDVAVASVAGLQLKDAHADRRRPVVIVHGANMSETRRPERDAEGRHQLRRRLTVCVDRLADEYVNDSPYGPHGSGLLTAERVPVSDAEWRTVGRSAGIARNQKMVDRGADLCLAFPIRDSKGTMHCLTAAVRAGIVTRVYPLAAVQRLATEKAGPS